MDLNNKEVKNINRLVEPFIHAEHAENRAAVAGLTNRGVIITMGDGTRIAVSVLKKDDEGPD